MNTQRVLILCTGNAARSQMAEGLLRHLAGDRFDVFGAGTKSVGLNPNAIRAMSEVGIDISHYRSKSVDEFPGRQFDCVITVCGRANDSCPIFPGNGTRIHESFPDPAAAPIECQEEDFRAVRNQIAAWLKNFIAVQV